jgi:hypothetical protein
VALPSLRRKVARSPSDQYVKHMYANYNTVLTRMFGRTLQSIERYPERYICSSQSSDSCPEVMFVPLPDVADFAKIKSQAESLLAVNISKVVVVIPSSKYICLQFGGISNWLLQIFLYKNAGS